MALAVHVTLRGVTTEQYDAVRTQAGWLEQPPAGGLSHLTWWEGADCHNIDAWESEDAFAAFAQQRLGPAMLAAGVAVEPEITMRPAHEVLAPRPTIIAPTATASLAGADNVTVLRGAYDAFAHGDVPAVLAMLDGGIDWYTPDSVAFGGRFTGPAEVAGFFTSLSRYFGELRVEPLSFVDRGDSVVAVGHNSGRTASGTAFDLPWVHVWSFSNGKATRFTEYFDSTKMNAALGVPAPRTASQPAGV